MDLISLTGLGLAGGTSAYFAKRAWARLLLSRAKHASLLGHPRTALRLSKALPSYSYGEQEALACDGAPPEVVEMRRRAFFGLAHQLRSKSPQTAASSEELAAQVSDLAFTTAYRVPFQFGRMVSAAMPSLAVAAHGEGDQIEDLDGNWLYDLSGAYGVNLFGNEFYKKCIERGERRARELGLVLGPYHPILADNVRRLREISGLDEVSFHMSGTEAVMQAVRLARYHTGRSHLVRFCGAYHGWSDGIQAGPGNPRPQKEVYTLEEMSETTLRVLRTRKDIACVLVNALQALAPNRGPSSDSTLLASDRQTAYDKEAYGRWLRQLRQVCDERGIVLIFDEVFLGFRLARGGVQEFFDVRADIVTYGKTLGGGLPVGVVCGRKDLMRRFDPQRPANVCFARGTFNSHPYVMATMNEFLRQLDSPVIERSYDDLEGRWNLRLNRLNDALATATCPVRVANMVSVWTTLYLEPSRYNWMFQFYLRAHGIHTAWTGTGRFIFSHMLSDGDFEQIVERFVAAGTQMKADGWWWQGAEQTNAKIKRTITREIVDRLLFRKRAVTSAEDESRRLSDETAPESSRSDAA